MPTRGDRANLQDPLAQQLLQSAIPARLAFTGSDGSPRVTPIWFHWDGAALVMSTGAQSSKVKAIERNPRLAVRIDTTEAPYRVLQIRGAATITRHPRATSEYALCATRYFGEELGAAWIRLTGDRPQARIALHPEWVELRDLTSLLVRARTL